MRFFRKFLVPTDVHGVNKKLDEVQEDLAGLLNNGILPEDNLDAEEYEVVFTNTGAADTQNVPHGLQRVPLRVEVVRADQGGVVYAVGLTVDDVDVETTVAGTYRIRIS